MLYKPTMPVPYNTALDPTTDMTFSCAVTNPHEITGVQLTIEDGSVYYCFEVRNNEKDLGYTIDDNNLKITLEANKEYNYYKITSTSRTNNLSGKFCGTDSDVILHSGKDYSWKVRLYQQTNHTEIAYGFIQELCGTTTKGYLTLKTRPHTNILWYFNNSYYDTILYNAPSEIRHQLKDYYDKRASYSISANGISFDIKAYYYSSSNGSDSGVHDGQLDSYGNPLFAYVDIDKNGNTVTSNDYQDTEYVISANYIDSNEFYFHCRKSAVLTLFDTLNTNINAHFCIGTEPDIDNALTVSYSNLSLSGTYEQNENISINCYKVMLYSVSDDSEKIINDTGLICSSVFSYGYDWLRNGFTYKIVIQILDTGGTTTVQSAYITPKYKDKEIPLSLSVHEHKLNKSVVVNFNDVISISGEESVANAHEFINEYINEKSVTSCSINEGNDITYANQDGTNKKLICDEPLLSMVVRCNHENSQQIFTLEDDNGIIYQLVWDGILFKYFKYQNQKYTLIDYYTPFNISSTITSFNSENPPNIEVLEDELKTKIFTAIKDSEISYDTPYIAIESIPFNDEYYYHTESVFNDFYWHIIATKNTFYIKCLNPPNGYSWCSEE